MTEIGTFLSSEEHGPTELVRFAQLAEEAGLGAVLISDHFHPWLDAQGESPFVWSVIGAIAATTRQRITTGVTCPIGRVHPAIIAQAAATSTLLARGGFVLGVGTGEALNEHILGEHWPTAETRLEQLEEAIAVIRHLFTGELVNHAGKHFTVENARLYSCPSKPPPIYMSAFGTKALGVASRIADGFITVEPAGDLVKAYRNEGGSGRTVAATKVCWGRDRDAAIELAHRRWATEALKGQLNQELPMPMHFEQVVELVPPEMVADAIACGPDPEPFVAQIASYLDAGFDELYLNQIGDDQAGFLDFYAKELAPRLGV